MPLSADYWKKRAEEVRAEADRMYDAECKEIMLDIARAYEQIADVAQRNSKKTSNGEKPARG
jgi:hypothetical protein